MTVERRPDLEESAEDLYENAPCGYLSAAPDGTIVRVNDTFLRWTGFAREELVEARRFQDLLTAGGRIYHETHFAPLLRMQGAVREIALEIARPDGSRLPVLVNSELKRDADGAPLLVRTTIFQATDRKRYEQELLAARDRERAARERVERLQRITAAVAAAPDARAVAAAVTDELVGALGAARAGVAVPDPATGALAMIAGEGDPQLAAPDFDEGGPGRGAVAQLRLRGAPGAGGRLIVAFDAPRAFDDDDRAFLRACAEQTALALERARLFELQRDVAHALQESLLDTELPQDPRFALATAYQPALTHLEVGGDWYDAFRLPGGRVAITVGDVVGRGVAAASAMGQLRSAVRALAAAGFGPAAILDHLDRFVEQVEPARFATLAYAEVDPATGRACCALAGHPPPLVTRPGRAPEFFMAGRSTPLGVTLAAEGRSQAAFELGAGAGFLLYTDGLVERRGEAIDAGLARLAEAVTALAAVTPAQLVEELPGAVLAPDAAHDDVCLLAFRLAPERR